MELLPKANLSYLMALAKTAAFSDTANMASRRHFSSIVSSGREGGADLTGSVKKKKKKLVKTRIVCPVQQLGPYSERS